MQTQTDHHGKTATKTRKLTPRAYLTYGAHLFKAIFRRYHQDLKPIFQQHIPEDAHVIDVGAHAGQFAKLFAQMAPQGYIHAFEPAGYTRSILSTVKKLHRLKNVGIVPLGLGDEAGTLTLNIPIKSSGSLGYGLSHIGAVEADDKRPTYQETITIVTLDDYVAENNITRVDFIKADIEGWELRMLAGAEETLKTHKPALFLEINDQFLGRAGDTAADMLQFLQKHDYDIFILDNADDGYALRDASDMTDTADFRGDILCVAKA